MLRIRPSGSRRLAAPPSLFRLCDEPNRRRAQARSFQRFDDILYSR
jgi:hypothetical protein